MIFNTHYNDNGILTGEENSGIGIVEKRGYIPAKKRIEEMILAGERLLDYRGQMYDLEERSKDDGISLDPIRNVDEELDYYDVYNQRVSSLKEQAEESAKRKHEDGAIDKEAPDDGSKSADEAKVSKEKQDDKLKE